MRFVASGMILLAMLLLTACERTGDAPAAPADTKQPQGATFNVPGLTEPAVPEGLSEPPRQKGEPNDRDANAARKKKPQKLVYSAPAEWVKIPACTGGVERYALKHVPEDREDAILDVERPARTAAGVGAIVDRWRAAFSGPGGAALPDGAFRSETLQVSGLDVTLVEIRGEHKAPGPAPARPGMHLLGAIIDTPAGFWAFKLIGPERTVAGHRDAFLEFVRAVRME